MMMKQIKILLPCLLFFVFHGHGHCQQSIGAAKSVKSVDVLFDFGKHDLRPDTDAELAEVLAFTKGKDNFTIKITAHTDSIGSLANNEALSKRRAQAVKEFLVKNGTPADRISFAFFGEKKPASTNDSEDGRQRNRRATVEVLLTLPMVTIEGTVMDEKTGQPLEADVVIRTKETNDTLRTAADGKFSTTVLTGTVVGIDAYAKCHFMKSEMVKALPKTPHVNLPLRPATKGAIADIDNLYFVGNQAVLLEKSKPELPKLRHFLDMNPDMKIEIAGHVNLPNEAPVGKLTRHFVLSEERAKMVYSFLLENGITEERISWKGYGNHEMRFPRATLEQEQALNRRVEIRVLEGGCE